MKKPKIPEIVALPNPTDRKLYFNNNLVEDLLQQYSFTACTDIKLRDEIMSHVGELIRQIIMTHNLHKIYAGGDDSSFMDLYQTAYVQIERVLYKYKARPHCAACYTITRPNDSVLYDPPPEEIGIITPEDVAKRKLKCPKCKERPDKIIYRGTSKIFNLMSQVCRTVILAYIKKENRDHKNVDLYKDYLRHHNRPISEVINKFIDEARIICKDNHIHQKIIDALQYIADNDDRPYDGLIGKLVKQSGHSRTQVTSFLKVIRGNSETFTNYPTEYNPEEYYVEDRFEAQD